MKKNNQLTILSSLVYDDIEKFIYARISYTIESP